MEKRGVVEPGRTPQPQSGEKQAAATGTRQQQIQNLDDDFTKRAADRAAASLKKPGS